jgi:hypothetical protein
MTSDSQEVASGMRPIGSGQENGSAQMRRGGTVRRAEDGTPQRLFLFCGSVRWWFAGGVTRPKGPNRAGCPSLIPGPADGTTAKGPVKPPLRPIQLADDAQGRPVYPAHHDRAPESVLADYLAEAEAMLAWSATPCRSRPRPCGQLRPAAMVPVSCQQSAVGREAEADTPHRQVTTRAGGRPGRRSTRHNQYRRSAATHGVSRFSWE